MDQSRTPCASAPATPDTAPRSGHRHHPVGLLYTLLRHGHGLTHEEAHRRSVESIAGPSVNTTQGNTTHASEPHDEDPPQAA